MKDRIRARAIKNQLGIIRLIRKPCKRTYLFAGNQFFTSGLKQNTSQNIGGTKNSLAVGIFLALTLALSFPHSFARSQNGKFDQVTFSLHLRRSAESGAGYGLPPTPESTYRRPERDQSRSSLERDPDQAMLGWPRVTFFPRRSRRRVRTMHYFNHIKLIFFIRSIFQYIPVYYGFTARYLITNYYLSFYSLFLFLLISTNETKHLI